jgi:hypothetical protein
VDFLLDAADRAMAELRRRHPRIMLGIALGLWLPVLAFLVLLTISSGVWPLVVLVSLPSVGLAVTVATRGLRRTWTWIWVLGTATILLICGVAVPRWPMPGGYQDTAIELGSFIYGQIYFGLLNVLDHFWQTRHRRQEPEDEERFRLRRMLQVRLLLASLIVFLGTTAETNGAQEPLLPAVANLFMILCMPVLIGVWLRLRPLAWIAAVVIAFLAVGNILVSVANREQVLAEFGWVQLVAIYLWIKAARVPYWPAKSAASSKPD